MQTWTQEFLRSHWITHAAFTDPGILTDVFRLQAEDPQYDTRYNRELCHTVLCFRRKFSLKEPHGVFRIVVTADDTYRLYVNGHPVCFGPSPAHLHVYPVDTVDVSPYLRSGVNVIAAEVYYQGLLNRERVSADGRCGLFLALFSEDSPVPLLQTDTDWRCFTNCAYLRSEPFGYHTQFPQHYDFRLAPRGWEKAGYDDSAWEHASAGDASAYRFRDARLPPMPIRFVRVPGERRKNGVFFDFSVEQCGYLFLRVRGRAGETIRVLSGEELMPDGTVRSRMRCNCIYEDSCILDDGENELLQIDYKGFRYCFVETEHPEELLDFGVLLRQHPFDETAFSFSSGHALFDDILRICRNAVRVNAQYNYLDCVTREKGAYNGDMTVIGAAHLYLTGKPDLYGKSVEDIVHTGEVVPGFNDYQNCSLADGALAEYSLGFPQQALTLYRYTGNREELTRNFRACEELLRYFAPYCREDGLLTAPFGEGIFRKEILVDWPASLRDGFALPVTPKISHGCLNPINAYYIGALDTVSEIRTRLGMSAPDTAPLKRAFLDAFYNRRDAVFRDGEGTEHASLHAQILPFYFGILPEDAGERARACARFVAAVRERGMQCGVYMAYFLLKALCRIGEYQLAFDLIVNRGRESWYTMLRGGAETCWEAWDADYKPNLSLCHAWGSAPLLLLVEEFLGLTVDVTRGCGYTLSPHLPDGLGPIRAAIPTPSGTVVIHLGTR